MIPFLPIKINPSLALTATGSPCMPTLNCWRSTSSDWSDPIRTVTSPLYGFGNGIILR